jgi:hypothetical protein
MKEVELVYFTTEEYKNEHENRIFIYAGINFEGQFLANEELMQETSAFENAMKNGVKDFPLFSRESLEKKEIIKKNFYSNIGIILKQDIYKFIETPIETNKVFMCVEIEN